MKRRQFLKLAATAGGGLLLGLPARGQEDMPTALLGENLSRLNAFVRIDPDGTIVIGTRTPDMGQGSHTVEARIIADALGADWDRVQVVALPLVVGEGGQPDFPLAPQFTLGSTTVVHAWHDLRQMGANARWLLRQAAARRWKLPAGQLQCRDSLVHAGDGRTLGYGVLAADAARLDLPSQPPALPPPSDYSLIGKPAGDVDAADAVRGRIPFTIDRWMGDALVAVIERCPYQQGGIDYVDDDLCLKVNGVVRTLTLPPPDPSETLGSVPQAAGVAVLARSTWAALRGRRALDIRWKPGRLGALDTALLERRAATALDDSAAVVVRDDGDVDALAATAHTTLSARYSLPMLAHVTMEPLACLVSLTDRAIRIEAPVQDPRRALEAVAKMTGLAPANIDISMPRMGGGFGRRLDVDHVAEAVRLAQQVNQPIKLMWTRGDMLRHDMYRPLSAQHLQAWLDRKGRILGWRHRLASTPWHARRGVPAGRLWQGELYPDALPAGLIDNYRLSWHAVESGVACGNWRAPGHNTTAFARECFLDEIAHATRRDALDLRLELLGEPRELPYHGLGGPHIDTGRMAAVLREAAERIHWKHRLDKRHGLGLACHFTFGSYCAHAFEVSADKGRLQIHRVVCVADVGRVINPSGVRGLMIGATLDGISAALHQAITLAKGQIEQHDLRDYRLASNRELPRKVEVHLMPSEAAPAGAGEAGLPSVAPALANAVFDATTVRIRRLPLMAELKRLI